MKICMKCRHIFIAGCGNLCSLTGRVGPDPVTGKKTGWGLTNCQSVNPEGNCAKWETDSLIVRGFEFFVKWIWVPLSNRWKK